VRDNVTGGGGMSSLEAFVIVCAVLLVGTPVCLWQIHRAWKAELAKNTDPYEVGPDEQPGADTAVQDALELLWDMPAYGTDDHTTTNPTGDQT
jgi:hypothetical protein